MSRRTLALVAALVIAVPCIAFAGYVARDDARETLQKILDENEGLKPLRVSSVYLPAHAGIPFYDLFVSLGVLPPRIEGTFRIERKDGAKLGNPCRLLDAGFRVSWTQPGGVYAISGPAANRLGICATDAGRG